VVLTLLPRSDNKRNAIGNKISHSSSRSIKKRLRHCFASRHRLQQHFFSFSFLFIVRLQHNQIMNDPLVIFFCPFSEWRSVYRRVRKFLWLLLFLLPFCCWHDFRLLHDFCRAALNSSTRSSNWTALLTHSPFFWLINRFQGGFRWLLTKCKLKSCWHETRNVQTLISHWMNFFHSSSLLKAFFSADGKKPTLNFVQEWS
jgi:hypothetical protein